MPSLNNNSLPDKDASTQEVPNTPLDISTSQPSMDANSVIAELRNPETNRLLSTADRADVLPLLFRVKGEPYSLTDYPQFKVMYSREYVPDLLMLCGRQIGKSCHEDTEVSLSNGLIKSIKDIQIGDMVLSKSDAGEVVLRRVTGKFYHGILRLVEIRTSGGKCIRITEEHRLCTTVGYTACRDLTERDNLLVLDQQGQLSAERVVAVNASGTARTYDIEVEDTNNFFANGICSHNSMNLSRSEVLDMVTIPHFQLLYVAPLQQQTQRYSTIYMTEAINSCPLAKLLQSHDVSELSDSKILTSVHHQAFANGSGIQFTYAKMSSDRARGIMADALDMDEIQDQLTDNIPIISESLTQSKWGIRRFTGTAKTTDNTIESLWQKSAQCEWCMRCTACGYWNIPNEDGRVLDMIQADGLHCVGCGNKLNVRLGEWVPAWPDRMDVFRGYHVPQIVLPAIVENENKWGKLLRKILNYPLPLIMQEVLGISCSVGARIITQQDIDRQSSLPSVKELQSKLRNYVITVGGLDWGGAEQQSFTVHTIIGVRPEGKIDVIWARRFMGFDPDDVLSEIAKAHNFYHCTMLAADYGMGFDKNIMLEQRFGIKVIQIMFMGNQHKLMSYSPTLGHPRWTVDRTTALELLFLAIRYGRIFFPPQSEFKIYTDDLLSPYEDISESGGLTSRKFLRNPHRPDDFCMALCFGSILAMKLVNSSMMDLVPKGAFNAGVVSDGSAPVGVDIDPNDVLAALQ